MPSDHYLALSFGGTHINSDMLVFVSKGTADLELYDMYSTSFADPVFDTAGQADYDWTSSNADYPKMAFNAIRALDTGDAQDFAVEFEKVISMGFAIRSSLPKGVVDLGTETNDFGDHSRHGHFDMILHDDYTTSYWGLYVSGAVGLRETSYLIAALTVLSHF